MEDTNLITKLKELKNIAPSKEWAVLAKIKMFDSPAPVVVIPMKTGLWQTISAMLFQKKLAYALVALAVLVAGSIGIAQFPVNSGLPAVSPAALVEAQNNVEAFKAKSKELATVAKNNPEGFSAAVDGVKEAAKQLTEAIQKNPGVAKEVALEINNNKTYLNVEGSAELQATSNDLYKTVVEQMIKDLEDASLTESQGKSLQVVKDLYEKERYTDALESILLLSMAMQNQ